MTEGDTVLRLTNTEGIYSPPWIVSITISYVFVLTHSVGNIDIIAKFVFP